MSNVEHYLEKQISNLETAVLRAEARAYGRVFNSPLPEPQILQPGPPIKLRWWFAALLIGAAAWGAFIWAVTR